MLTTNMDNKQFIYECTIVSGKINNTLFLFKNGDNPTIWDHEIIRDIVNGNEVLYSTNQNGWAEGISERGICFVYSYLTKNPNNSINYKIKGKAKLPKKETINPEYLSEKGKKLLDIISSNTLEIAIQKAIKHNYSGNYFISDGIKTVELEIFRGIPEWKYIDFSDKKFKVKTNHGILLPWGGQIKTKTNLRRSDSEIRKSSAEKYLIGFSNFKDVMTRMGFQEFDRNSPLNVFRTDDAEKTTTQILMDATNKKMYYILYDDFSKFYGVINKLPKNYTPKIKLEILNRDEFDIQNDFKKFINNKNN